MGFFCFYIPTTCTPLPASLTFPRCLMKGTLSQQEFPGLDKLSPSCSGTSTPRGNVLASHSPMSPESMKMAHRHRYGLGAGEGPLRRGESGYQRSEPPTGPTPPPVIQAAGGGAGPEG